MPWNNLLETETTGRGVFPWATGGVVTGTVVGDSVDNNITSLSHGTREEVACYGEVGIVKGGGDVRYICCDCMQ